MEEGNQAGLEEIMSGEGDGEGGGAVGGMGGEVARRR